MPRPTLSPSMSPAVIQGLLMELERFQHDEAAVRKEYPWASRFVMGLPLAPWQRDFKWTEEQSRRFMTSAWTGVHLGSYIMTEMRLRPLEPGFDGVEYEHLSNCVIEGQQRLKSLELYLTDQLAVPDADGKLALWSEVAERDQRRFKNTIFTRGTIRVFDESSLRDLYDLMNFGGTPHEEHERATAARELN